VNVYVRPSGRDVPLLGKAGDHLGGAALEVDDAAVDLAVGVERRAGRVHAGIEVLGAAFRAVDERLGGRAAAAIDRAIARATIAFVHVVLLRRAVWVSALGHLTR
jgi:hypothetical protein